MIESRKDECVGERDREKEKDGGRKRDERERGERG